LNIEHCPLAYNNNKGNSKKINLSKLLEVASKIRPDIE
jgi:hypothetical protein